MSSKIIFSRKSIFSTITFGVLLVNLVVGTLATLWLKQSMEQRKDEIFTNTTNISQILEQDLEDIIDKVDITIRSVNDEYARQSVDGVIRWENINDYTLILLARQPKLDLLIFSNAAGEVIFGSGGKTNSKINIADREFFARLRDNPDVGMVVEKPFVGKIGEHLLFARRLYGPEVAFGGVIVAGISIERLQKLFSKLNIGPHGKVLLRAPNLETIVNYSPRQATGTDLDQQRQLTTLREHLKAEELSGVFTATDPGENVERTVAFRHIGLYPLLITVSVSSEDYLTEWRNEAVKVVSFVMLFLLVSIAVAWQLLRSWQHRARAYQMLRDSEERLRLLAENASDTISRFDHNGIYLDVSKSASRLLGFLENDLRGHPIKDFIHPEDMPALAAARRALMESTDPQILAHRHRHRDGRYIWIESNIQAIRDDANDVTEFVAVSRDITERKQADARIEFMAHHDPLTKLPNRLLGRDRVELSIARAERGNLKVAVLFLDLDQFKKVNDSLGHAVGDALLQSVTVRLLARLRDSDTLCRQGGDEFLILLEDLREAEVASRVASTVLESLTMPFVIDERELYISGSIGIAVYPDDGHDFDTLLKKADTAMYHAKESGRNAFRFFSEQMNVDTTEYLNLCNGLRRALERRQFVLHYQPQINLRTGDVVGVEALIRWQHPDIGLVPPGRFIPVAEDSGLIVPIGAWVLAEACRQAAEWHRNGFSGLVVAVNLSAAQFKRGDLLHNITSALALSQLDPSCLELELTESILISDSSKVLTTVNQLKTQGIKLSIDDFGTGYSSLAYLKRFNVDKLKIDQSFVRDISTDPNDTAIVYAIVQMARSLGLTTIAEGVEDAATLATLREQGCDEAQGYFFAKPLPANELVEFLSVRPKTFRVI